MESWNLDPETYKLEDYFKYSIEEVSVDTYDDLNPVYDIWILAMWID